MTSAKEALIGMGLAMIVLYILLITVVSALFGELFDLFRDFGLLIVGISSIFIALIIFE